MSSNIFDLLNEEIPVPVKENILYLKGSDLVEANGSPTKLILIDCPNIRNISISGDYITYIEIINCPKMKHLPKDCPNIKTLIINGCTGIRKIPETYTSISQIALHKSDIISIPDQIAHSLHSIDIVECHGLTSLGGPLYTNLTMISATSCNNLSAINNTYKIKHLYIEDCPNIYSIPKGKLETIFIKNCPLVRVN